MTATEMTWTVTPEEWDRTRAAVAKINARAERRGFTGRITIAGTPITRQVVNAAGFHVEQRLVEVTLGGEAPCYSGWRLLAALDWDPAAGLVTRPAPGVESIDRDGLREGWCDHCEQQRGRRHTYLVEHVADGQRLQVGSTCLKDFLGWQGRVTWMSAASVRDELDGRISRGEPMYAVESVLAIAWAAVTTFGFRPTSASPSTRDLVLTVLEPRNRRDEELGDQLRPLAEAAAEKARELRAWIASDEFGGASEYALNLRAVAGAEFVTVRNVGLLVSAPQAYAKAQQQTLIRQREREEIHNEWVGRPGDRLVDLRVKISAVHFSSTAWGTTTIYKLLSVDESCDGGRHLFTWFASRSALGEDAGEDVLTINGTVKDHDEYQGTKNTIITRVTAAS